MRERLLKTVSSLGGEVYLIGGAVRDGLLGLEVKDADYLVTGVDFKALRAKLEAWARVDVVGASFGVLKVTHQDETVDVALPRTERSTGIHHRDFEVTFDSSLRIEDDLARRDFTINALALRLRDDLLIDPFGGRADLEAGVLRAVGEARDRFSEDALRMLRLSRFIAKLGFTPHPDTFQAALDTAHLVESVAPERVQTELLGLLKAPNSNHVIKALRFLRDAGLLLRILPEYAVCTGFDQQNPYHHLTLDEHMFHAVMYTVQNNSSFETRLAALLHDIGKPRTQSFGADGIAHYYFHEVRGAEITKTVLERLKCSNELLETVVKLVRQHMRPPKHPSTKSLRKFVNDLGPHWRDALELRRADILAHAPEPDFDADTWFETTAAQCASFPPHLELFDERALAISGDLLTSRFGLTGKAIGDAKKAATQAVIEGELENEREAILAWISTFVVATNEARTAR